MSREPNTWPPDGVHVDDLNYDDLDPGIRSTVRWLRGHGYDTCDSGDGRTKFEAAAARGEPIDPDDNECGVTPHPHVAIQVHPDRLVEEADRLCGLLRDAGIKVGPLDFHDGPSIQATYDAGDGYALIYVANVVVGEP